MGEIRLRISISGQRLEFHDGGRRLAEFPVSTSRYGPGERLGSGCTPRGRHCVRARIGAGLPAGAILRGRRPTGASWNPALAAAEPHADWILSRILWLSGCEPGFNRLGAVDTMRRYIYIHGAPDTAPMGVPFSHGCIRMRNGDMIRLFDMVPLMTPVDIVP
jgi:lipoprotein-anchoring transpeptidase ErfK/SrfK